MADYKNEFGVFGERPKVEKKLFDQNKVVIGIMIFLVMITDSWHNLYLGGKREFNQTMVQDGGPASWANVFYSYLIILLAVIVLIVAYRRSAGYYRKQIATILAAVVLPWIVNALMPASSA